MSFLGSQAVNLMFLCFSFWLSDMSCGDPPDVNNGFRVFNSTGYNSTATYTCNKGYGLNSKNAVKRCTAKKKWEGLKPRCRKSAFAYLSQMLKVWPSRPYLLARPNAQAAIFSSKESEFVLRNPFPSKPETILHSA